jgi:calcium-dependent protein kinase
MNKSKVKCPDLVGTVSYMAPEIIKGYFTDKCDVWSCGVIFYILLTSKSPFRCPKKESTLKKILTH